MSQALVPLIFTTQVFKDPFNIRFEVLTVLSIEITVFWDMMPCSLVCTYHCFGGTCFFHPYFGSRGFPCRVGAYLPYYSASYTKDYTHVYLDVPSMYSIYTPYIPNTSLSEEFVYCEAFLKVPLWHNILRSVTHPGFNLQTRDNCPQTYTIYFTAVLFALLNLNNCCNIVCSQSD
jgi:hypothetical protein